MSEGQFATGCGTRAKRICDHLAGARDFGGTNALIRCLIDKAYFRLGLGARTYYIRLAAILPRHGLRLT